MADQDGDKEQVDEPAEGDHEWFTQVLEAILVCRAIEVGGKISISPERLHDAFEKAQRWYPNGLHVHYEGSPSVGYTMEMVDAARCDKAEGHATERAEWVPGGESRMVHSFDDAELVQMEGAQELAGPLSFDDMRKVSHAQHVLLTVALARLGATSIEATREEYERASALSFGESALLISKRRDAYRASIVHGKKVGNA